MTKSGAVLSVVLFAFAVSLAACGGGGRSTPPTPQPTSTGTAQPIPAPTPTVAPTSSSMTPAWPTFHRDGTHSGLSSVDVGGGRRSIAPIWKFATGGSVESSPTLGAGGLIYFGSGDGYLYCLNTNGSLRWKFNTGAGISTAVTIGPDGALYTGSGNYMVAVNADGSLRWKFLTQRRIVANATLSNDGSTVYAASFDHNLYALSTATGALKWTFTTNDGIDATPTVGPGAGTSGPIYVGSYDGFEYSLTDGGTAPVLNWKFNTSFLIESTAVIDSAGFIYVANDLGLVFALDPTTGKPGLGLPVVSAGAPIYSSNAMGPVSGGTQSLFIAGSNGILSRYTFIPTPLGPIFGAPAWSYNNPLPFFSSPALSMPAGADGVLIVGGQDNNFYEFDASNGALLVQFPTGGPIDSSPAIGADGTVYIGSKDMNLYAFH